MKKRRAVSALLAMGAVLLTAGFAAAQENPKPTETKEAPADALLGVWAVQVDGGDAVYYLTVTLKKEDGPLAGTVSEMSGYFTDVPLNELSWDGTTLKFQAVTVTPPDGVERPWYAEMKRTENGLAGTVSLPDMGAVLPATGTRTEGSARHD